MTIHSEHPFADPSAARDAARRLRGRLIAPVTLWCAGDGTDRAGLTVSSVLVALGTPARLLGLLDPAADVWAALEASGVFTVSVLTPAERALADAFDGHAPAPGGPFAQASFVATAWGPVPVTAGTWAGCRLESVRPLGWSVEVTATIESVTLEDRMPLAHLRGRYLDEVRAP